MKLRIPVPGTVASCRNARERWTIDVQICSSPRRASSRATTVRRATSSTQYPLARFGITPFACWRMPASSTSVWRWSVRTSTSCGSTAGRRGGAERVRRPRAAPPPSPPRPKAKQARRRSCAPRPLRRQPLGLLDEAADRALRARPDRRTARARLRRTRGCLAHTSRASIPPRSLRRCRS